jgi:hypothetical protein
MSKRRAFSGKLRWTPLVAMVVAAAVLTGTMLANAAGPPLPKRTPAQLLADMRNASPPAAMSAVITEKANLGFPSLPDIAGLQSSVLSGAAFLTGTHTVDIWYAGPRHVRIAVPVSFGETDLRVNGNQVWLWNSHGQTATHYVLPALPTPAQIKMPTPIRLTPAKIKAIREKLGALARLTPAKIKAIREKLGALARLTPAKILAITGRIRALKFRAFPGVLLPRCIVMLRPGKLRLTPRQILAPARIAKCVRNLKFPPGVRISLKPVTPQQATSKFLAAIGPTTNVSVGDSTVVAGRSAYQLIVAPRTSQSLISRIVIAVDSKTYMPLQLQVFARGVSNPAFQIGFTSLTLGTPAASNFSFTPPPGAHVKTVKLPQAFPGLMGPLAAHVLPVPLPAGSFTGQRWLSAHPTQAKVHVVRLRAVSLKAALPSKIAKLIARPGKFKLSLMKRLEIAQWIKRAGTITVHTWAEGAVVKVSATAPSEAVATFQGPLQLGGLGGLGALPGAALSGVKVLGSGWLSVAVLPVGALANAAALGGKAIPSAQLPGGPHPVTLPGGSASGAQILALLHILLNSAAKVHGSWGSGRLLRTNLFSVLITNNGKVLIGAVTPAVLYADAAKVK